MALRLTLSDYDTSLEAAEAAISAGGIVVYPTDTLYGIGCDATSSAAVAKLRALKKRDATKPLSILVSDYAMLQRYCAVSPEQERILYCASSGPIHVHTPSQAKLPVCGGMEAGVRVPEHQFMRTVSKQLGTPIVTTSANLSGEKGAAEAGEVSPEIANGADLFIDGGRCQYAQGSTVLDLVRMKVLRRGAVRKGDVFEWENMKAIQFGALTLKIAPTVYEPAEDSFLLATYASSLSGRILEIGCGCGIASLSAAQANLKNSVLGVDINPEAVECAQGNAEENKIRNAQFTQSDLFSNIPAEKFDAILFNPPYLPTTREEKLVPPDENAAYDGGESGLEAFRKFAAGAPAYLAQGGKVAVIATSLGGGIDATLSELESRIGKAEILAQESFFFEKIALIEASRV